MEMTMRKKILSVLVVTVALTAQAAAASEYHHTRTKARAVASEQLRNSNAYAAPGDIAVQPNWTDEAEGAMTSGIAGH
jgi:CHASE3 domain sensor protein